MYNVLDYLEKSCKKYPEKVAVVCENEKITYKDYVEYSKKVGTYLSTLKVFNSPILVFMDKGIDTLISFFGIVYSGCYYVLVNPDLPKERITSIKEVTQSKIVITDKDNLDFAKDCFSDLKIFVPLIIYFSSRACSYKRPLIVTLRHIVRH